MKKETKYYIAWAIFGILVGLFIVAPIVNSLF